MSATIKNVVKIAPKPMITSPGSAGSSSTAGGNKIAQLGDGKFVVIQNSKGIQIPLKVVTQSKAGATPTSQTTTTNNIQILKSPTNVQLVKKPTSAASEGNPTLIQIAPSANQHAGLGTTPKTKFIVKTGNNQQVILATPSSIPAQTEVKKSVVGPASSIMIGMKDGSPTIKVEKETMSSPTSESSVLKFVSPTSSQSPGIHAVNIPGKGIKYVKILNSGVSPSSVLTSSTSTSQKPLTPTKLTAVPAISKPSQLLIKNRDGKTMTVLQQKSAPVTTTTTSTVPKPVVATQEKKPEVKIESAKKHSIQISTKSSDEPPSKKTKYITLTTSQINQIQGVTIMQKEGESKKIVMLPSNYAEQLEKLRKTYPAKSTSIAATTPKTTLSITPLATSSSSTPAIKTTIKTEKHSESAEDPEAADDDGKKKKRACNCTKSMCLKFYCDCFANGEFCQNCNCKDCLNLVDCPEREKAIKLCLEKNPLAFKPKIASDLDMSRLHVKGCNCKRSGCLKNYCECYEAKISCSSNCKCLGCKNCDDASEKLQMELNYLKSVGKRGSMSDDSATDVKIVSIKKDPHTEIVDVEITKKPYNFMTQDVIEATVQCMIAQAEECQKLGVSKKISEKLILEEFGRCLVEIIEFSNKNVQ